MIRVGFIGAGNFSIEHAKVLVKLGASIAACYSTNRGKAEEFSKLFQAKQFDCPLQMVSKQYIDVLYIVVPPFAHDGTIEHKAINESIPFLCEKPLGLDMGVCQEIALRLKETGLITSSGYQFRQVAIWDEVKSILQRNQVSTIRMSSYSYMPKVHWWRQMEKSGGMMVEVGTHYVDILRYLFGEIVDVNAFVSTGIAEKNYENCNIYDSMEAIFKFEQPIIASMGVTHLLKTRFAREDILQIYGDDFVLHLDWVQLRYHGTAQIKYKEPGQENWKTSSHAVNREALLLKHSELFLKAVKTNEKCWIKSDYLDALETQKVTNACNQSAFSEEIL